ncbi:hypothetical protein M413DRAFT_276570 [Hebeloma cylindrosporum]|uniref:Uncharacterized protein n=1 Tax=Hebeloma cylindrosporum TaxID=76867 RepID=A0A0C2XHD4_HEBCY|nr:hypothetical protein M413DRAFT_276570 [Hebeloma cylindrosporum h7]
MTFLAPTCTTDARIMQARVPRAQLNHRTPSFIRYLRLRIIDHRASPCAWTSLPRLHSNRRIDRSCLPNCQWALLSMT